MPARHGAIRVPVDLRVVMRMQIDEPRGHNEPVGVERFLSRVRFKLADFGNLAIFNSDVSKLTRRASAINNCSTLNDYIKFRYDCPPCKLNVHSAMCLVPCHWVGAAVNRKC